ncbi:MAG: 3-hydroxyacyl-CoA dehydrogenase NAD-binding domain-containing protein, partial [Candidatus Poribacteria bacterium]
TGKTLSGDRAYKLGLVEQCLPRESFEESVQSWAKKNMASMKAGNRLAKQPKLGGLSGIGGSIVGSVMEKTPLGRSIMLKKARGSVLGRTKGQYPAPIEAINVIQTTNGCYGEQLRGVDRRAALAVEAKGFAKLAVGEVCKNLIRIFYLTEAVKKSKGLPIGTSAETRHVRSAAILGAGIMGGGIAQLFAAKGFQVRLKDLNTKALAAGVQAAVQLFKKQVQKKKLTSRQGFQKISLISPVLDYSGFNAVSIVVEAVVENLEVKQQVFKELEGSVSDTCVIATNTSSLSVSKMQSSMRNPERLVGMHFFNPVHKMPLIEVIKGEKTSNEALTTVFQLSKQLGKTPIVVKDAPGFLVNRLLLPYLNEATFLVEQGVPIDEVDRVLLEFGMPMGPLELIDEVGIDVGDKVAHILNEAFGERAQPSSVNSKIITAGRLGKKNEKGFYVYEGREKKLDPKIYDILSVTPKYGLVPGDEILDRCILPMINEASRCLAEDVVSSASDVDLGMIMGTGFPPFRGGLLKYADGLGLQEIVKRLKEFEEIFGKRFEPSEALVARLDGGCGFLG